MTTVYFDLETGGLKDEAEITQLAAISVGADWAELGRFTRRLKFDVAKAEPEALKVNGYNEALWELEGIAPASAAREFGDWLRPYRAIQMTSKKTGYPYLVARLVAFNSSFDGPRIKKLFQEHGVFLPAHPAIKCVYQLALWEMDARGETLDGCLLMNLKYLCGRLGVAPAPQPEGFHDALYDVRAAVQLARKICERQGGGHAL